MIDRFGPLPRPAENLLAETEIRILAGAWKLERIHVEKGQYVVLTYRDSARMEALARRHPGLVRIVDAKKSYVPLGEDPVKTPEIVERATSFVTDLTTMGIVQKRPFSGTTRNLSADPDRSRVEACATRAPVEVELRRLSIARAGPVAA